MRKQEVILKHQAHAALFGPQVHTVGRVEQRSLAKRDASDLRCEQPGDDIEDTGLAAARGTDERGDVRRGGEFGLEREPARVAVRALEVKRLHGRRASVRAIR